MWQRLASVLVSYWWVVLLIAMGLVYAITMILSIGQPVWFDEGYSIYVARQPLAELLSLTAVDAHPPLYYVLLKLWAGVFGWSEFALRSLSGVAAALSVGAVFMTVKKLFSVRVALSILPFLILAPFVLRYGYEVRMYAVAGLIGALATMVLTYAVDKSRASLWVIYAVLVALGMYTLYMMAALWFAHALWLLVRSIRRKEKFKQWKWFFAYILAVILFLPYIRTFFYQLNNSALPGIGKEISLTSVVDMGTMLSLYAPEWSLGGWVSLVLAIMSISLVWLLVKLWRSSNSADKNKFLFIACLAIVPILFYAVTSLPPRDPIFVNRYLAHTAIWIYLLVGLLLALAWKYQSKIKVSKSLIITIGLAALLVAGNGVIKLEQTGNLVFERMQKPRTIELRDEITCDNNTTVVAADPYTYLDSVYYFEDCDFRFFAENDLAKKGGYAPLSGSQARISSSEDLDSRKLIHLRWESNQGEFMPDDRYQLVESNIYDRQVVDTYILK